MSSSSEQEGFRSRDEDLKRRIELRKKIFAEFYHTKELKQHKQEPVQKQYVGLSHTLAISPPSEQEDFIDMFADENSKDGAVGNKVDKEETTDESGYYNIYSGKIVGAGKFRLIEKIGKGMFGVVAKAETKEGNQFVALKIIRKNQMMLLSGEKEYKILSGMKSSDFIVGVTDYFYEEGHLFLNAELMGPDLRSFVRKNQDKITLESIKQYAISMFMSLHELRKNKIIHADIKPDNFLLTQDLSKIKLTDFGTAFSVEEHTTEVEYLVARYYRAPQIILGCEMPVEHRYSIDTWAVGCSLYELFTGHFLFQGNSNSDMLHLMMQTRGRFSAKMLKKCVHLDKYFDSEFNFLHEYYDQQSKTTVIKKWQPSITPERDILNLLRKHALFQEDPKLLSVFRDFLESCLVLNPKGRITPQLAFQHPFLNHMIKLS